MTLKSGPAEGRGQPLYVVQGLRVYIGTIGEQGTCVHLHQASGGYSIFDLLYIPIRHISSGERASVRPENKHQAPSTKHQAPSTKHQAPSTKHQAPSNKQQTEVRMMTNIHNAVRQPHEEFGESRCSRRTETLDDNEALECRSYY
jgi:hypothetical protein